MVDEVYFLLRILRNKPKDSLVRIPVVIDRSLHTYYAQRQLQTYTFNTRFRLRFMILQQTHTLVFTQLHYIETLTLILLKSRIL